MTVNRVTFTDPATSTTFVWPRNPGWDAESPMQKQIQIERTSNSGNVGATKQQGDDGPLIWHWEFDVFTSAFELALRQWYALSRIHTIYLTDWEMNVVEGQIVTLSWARKGASGGPGDTNARKFFHRFIFEFEVYTLISGPLFTAGLVP